MSALALEAGVTACMLFPADLVGVLVVVVSAARVAPAMPDAWPATVRPVSLVSRPDIRSGGLCPAPCGDWYTCFRVLERRRGSTPGVPAARSRKARGSNRERSRKAIDVPHRKEARPRLPRFRAIAWLLGVCWIRFVGTEQWDGVSEEIVSRNCSFSAATRLWSERVVCNCGAFTYSCRSSGCATLISSERRVAHKFSMPKLRTLGEWIFTSPKSRKFEPEVVRIR